MRFFAVAAVLGTLSSVHATTLQARASDPFKAVNIASPDGSAKATFIPFGATATQFWVRDRHGEFRDILLGYDNYELYKSDVIGHPYFGPVVGRYANRIKNSTFEVNGKTYHTPPNENGGADTLHGGTEGYDRRVWTVAKQSKSSATFTLTDADGSQGFPGTVKATVVYTLENKSTWKISMKATADQDTPIMLSGHHYWNFEAYKESQDLIGHHAQFAASQVIGTDPILIPDGSLINVTNTPLDFRKAKSLGVGIQATTGHEYCGGGCIGYDNAWVYDDNKGTKPVFSIWSVLSGIRLDVTTNQPALQIYTCNGLYNASLPIGRKTSQGGHLSHYTQHSCLVIEQESWIDGINNPEWKINQIYGPNRSYDWQSTYAFSVTK